MAKRSPKTTSLDPADPGVEASPRRRGGPRGFASLAKERLREIGAAGGRAMPAEARAYSKSRELASAAGRKGGAAVPPTKRAFARDPELAKRAGRLGALASLKTKRRKRAKA